MSRIAQRRGAKAARRKKLLSERRKAAGGEMRLSLVDQMRRMAATAPIHSCLAPPALFENGMGAVVLTRKSAGGTMVLASFLVDVFCCGVKDVMVRHGGEVEVALVIEAMSAAEDLATVDPAYARKLLRDLVAWSRSLGLAPHADYAAAELLFGAVSPDACSETFSFGKNGRPLYMPGPMDTPAQTRQRTEALRRQLGDDGFDYALASDGLEEVEDIDEIDAEDEDDAWEAEGDAAIEEFTGMRYDPNVAPDTAAWQELDEIERQSLIEAYHRRAGIDLPNERVHAALHTVVENQAALGDELPVRRTIARLMTEGLDRHEAIHAVGSVLSKYMYEIMQGGAPAADPQADYNAAVERLTAESWRAEFSAPDEDESR